MLYLYSNYDLLLKAAAHFKYKIDFGDHLFRGDRYIIRANGERINNPKHWEIS